MSARTIATVIALLVANFVSCSLFRLAFGGKFIIDRLQSSTTRATLPHLYLISGLKSQPAQAYQRLNFSDYQVAYCRFSCLGYNPFRAGRQLTRLLGPDEVICGLSIGAKALECSQLPPEQPVILINPCSYPEILNRRRRLYPCVKYVAPFAEVALFLAGWIAVVPFLSDNFGEPTSLALILDQLFWVAHGQPCRSPTRQTGVVISQQDEWVPLDQQRIYYAAATAVEITASHGRIANRHYAPRYAAAIDTLLQQISGA